MALPLGVLLAGGAALSEVVLRPYRAIVGVPPADQVGPPTPSDIFIADAVVSETHDDEMSITDHPVEFGAEITDHAFVKPGTLTVMYGWAAGSLNAISQNGGLSSSSFLDADLLKGIYERIRKLMVQRTIVSVYTGKRVYTSMLVRNLRVETTKETEHALLVRITLREVNIVRTQIVVVPDDVSQASPEENGTGNVISVGPKQLGPAPNFVPFDTP